MKVSSQGLEATLRANRTKRLGCALWGRRSIRTMDPGRSRQTRRLEGGLRPIPSTARSRLREMRESEVRTPWLILTFNFCLMRVQDKTIITHVKAHIKHLDTHMFGRNLTQNAYFIAGTWGSLSLTLFVLVFIYTLPSPITQLHILTIVPCWGLLSAQLLVLLPCYS